MRGTQVDVELDGGLDGASITDDSPEPDDEDLRARRLFQNHGSARQSLSKMRRDEST